MRMCVAVTSAADRVIVYAYYLTWLLISYWFISYASIVFLCFCFILVPVFDRGVGGIGGLFLNGHLMIYMDTASAVHH